MILQINLKKVDTSRAILFILDVRFGSNKVDVELLFETLNYFYFKLISNSKLLSVVVVVVVKFDESV